MPDSICSDHGGQSRDISAQKIVSYEIYERLSHSTVCRVRVFRAAYITTGGETEIYGRLTTCSCEVIFLAGISGNRHRDLYGRLQVRQAGTDARKLRECDSADICQTVLLELVVSPR